jgi:hypothetical protein
MAKRTYEGSPADLREDARGAKKTGKSLKAYERTPRDKAEDAKGQKRLFPKGRR